MHHPFDLWTRHTGFPAKSGGLGLCSWNCGFYYHSLWPLPVSQGCLEVLDSIDTLLCYAGGLHARWASGQLLKKIEHWDEKSKILETHKLEHNFRRTQVMLRDTLIREKVNCWLLQKTSLKWKTAKRWEFFINAQNTTHIPSRRCIWLRDVFVLFCAEDQNRQTATEAQLHSVVLRLGALLVLMLTVGNWSDVFHVLIAFLGEATCLLPSQDLLQAVLKVCVSSFHSDIIYVFHFFQPWPLNVCF